MNIKIKIVLIALILVSLNAKSQEVIDQIVAVVGDKIILKSEIETQYIQLRAQGYYPEGDINCDILEEMLFQKLMLNQAILDSIEITSRDVDSEIDRRLSVFINQYGSERKLEEVYGKSIAQIRADFREIIRDQLLTQKMQMSLLNNISITPQEVRNFFNAIPKDSLPIIEAYYEYSELVVEPKIGEEERSQTIQQLEGIRERIINGESFSTMAVLYSQDQGTAIRGGELGFVSREDLVPEFAGVAFNLTNTSDVSRVVRTEFGYHIIQLIEKRGTLINVRHILISPRMSDDQIELAEKEIANIFELLTTDSINFSEAVRKYSTADSKFNDGVVANPYTGTRKIVAEMLDPITRRNLNQLKPGEISRPFLATTVRGQRVFKIIRLDKKVEEHIANLEDDYRDIHEFALQKAQQEHIMKWINNAIDSFYIRIDPSYGNCEFQYADWNKNKK